jgi:hypothetical protein
MQSPWPGRSLGIYKDSYNYWLSHSRQAIDRAFGMLCMRWGVYWRPFRFRMDRWALVNIVCMKLYNFYMDRNQVTIPTRYSDDCLDGDELVIRDNNNVVEDEIARARATGDRRRNITAALEAEGRLRPIHARINSRV